MSVYLHAILRFVCRNFGCRLAHDICHHTLLRITYMRALVENTYSDFFFLREGWGQESLNDKC